nr:histidine phosphatase family protein [Schlegelella koreensis]
MVRHGETALNAARVLQPPDTPLSPRGLAQAAALAERLAGMGVAAIVSSDHPRARQTADAIAARCEVDVELDATLRERDFGALRGRLFDSLGYDPLALVTAPPGGESLATFTARVAGAFESVLARRAAAPGPLVVVTHGLVIATMLREHADLAAHARTLRIGNASMTVLEAQSPCRIELLACTRHLDAGTIGEPGAATGG